ncbi:GNAT family N-acetyltransferase [Epidermidibacterium keratini]|uniref:GNAT family N-acetyltransferase n=1 Tax=Epidermidibacterium keratini TaxID=1891644 RepID=A0A7L4YNX8_9ACTN|nr:GNAT family N-acetyltransferase [Epidermidibacterium keratini]QHC00981.1 GNAT family N-acetyltransferase [Epidermidibacterium keratini]
MDTDVDLHSMIGVRSLLARAYANDPMMRWVFPEPATRTDCIAAWLGLYVERYAEIGLIKVIGGDPAVAVGVGRDTALPRSRPDTFPSPSGILRALVGREHSRTVTAAMARLASLGPQRPALYLQFLAVDPQEQGSGYGRELLAQLLQLSHDARKPIKLETTNPVNVDFYRKFGFSVVDDMRLGIDGPTGWSMWRDAD